jgi:xylulokinase
MTADILELPVKIPSVGEAAAFGAALQSLWMMNSLSEGSTSLEEITREHVCLKPRDYHPMEANIPVYRKGFSIYNSYVKSLSPLYI